MPIARTPIYNDDGSGTVGTVWEDAWKQELYNQIDAADAAAAGAVGASQIWTPADISGAGLVFPTKIGRYSKMGQTVVIVARIDFPATADPTPVTIGGLPFPCAFVSGGFYQTYGATFQVFLDVGQTGFNLLNPATLAVKTNAQMSGSSVRFAGIYFTN